MAHSVHVIGGEPDLENMVRVGMEPGGCGHADLCRRGQYKDTCVVLAQTDLVFGADHAMALYAPDLSDLHGDGFAFNRVDGGAGDGYHDFLPGSYVRSAAYDGQGFRF